MITTFDDGLQLSDQFWDCECKTNYIHPAKEKVCPICGARREDMPDSRVNEIKEQLGDVAEL